MSSGLGELGLESEWDTSVRPSQGKLRGLALCGDHFSESRSRLGLTWLFPILLVDGAVWHSEQHGGKERKALPGMPSWFAPGGS